MVADPFDSADYYDCDREAEEYRYRTPQAAIRACAPLTGPWAVHAFKRQTVRRSWLRAIATHLVDVAEQCWGDEWGNPNDADHFKRAVRSQCARAFEAALVEAAAHTKVWACEHVGERTYSVEEVERILKGRRP